MSYQSTEVYRYLIFVQKYFLGDLSKFNKLCYEAEQEEQHARCLATSTTNSTTTIIETTKYPYSFEFMFGDPVISRSTIPHTGTLFATIDLVGFLIRTGTDYRYGTTKNFNSFVNDPSINLSSIELSIFIKVYRHGMTHNYFPKLNMEISCHSSNPVGKMFFKNNHGDIVLNVNHLITVTTTRLDQIISNSSLYSNMTTQ